MAARCKARCKVAQLVAISILGVSCFIKYIYRRNGALYFGDEVAGWDLRIYRRYSTPIDGDVFANKKG